MFSSVPAASAELALRASPDEVRRASSWLTEFAEQHAVPTTQIQRLDLCMHEAVANVIEHGDARALQAGIELRLTMRRDAQNAELALTVSDAGVAFNPLTATPKTLPATLAEATPGGLGLTMMQAFSDDQEYAYEDGHNHVTFYMYWNNTPHFGRQPDRRTTSIPVLRDRRRNADTGDRRRRSLDWIPLFHNTDITTVSEEVHACEVSTLPAGTPLLKAGDRNDCVYLLLSGRLVAHLDSTLMTTGTAIPIEPGECIGELSVIDGNPASASVTALTDARVLKLPRELFMERLLTIPGVAGNLLTALSERMRRSNQTMLEAQRKRLMLEHLNKELDVARQLQMGMLPLQHPLFPERTDIEVEGLMEPASNVGGDLFDVFFVGENRLFFCIGDVSGHGITAALFMARAIGLIRVAAMSVSRPDTLLARINDHLCKGNDINMFASLFCGFLDITTGRLTYSNGGHLAPLLMHNGKVSPLPLPKGSLAGVLPGTKYAMHEIMLEHGDTLICYTDGITEAQTHAGEEFTEHNLIMTVAQNAGKPVGIILNAVREAVAQFSRKALDDDCTMLAIRRL